MPAGRRHLQLHIWNHHHQAPASHQPTPPRWSLLLLLLQVVRPCQDVMRRNACGWQPLCLLPWHTT
jgi:hypothetical protein